MIVDRKPSNIKVNVLDLSVLCGYGKSSLSVLGQKIYQLEPKGELGLVRTNFGEFIVHSDGVMSKSALSDMNPWAIDLYCKSSQMMLPIGVINITPNVLRDIPVKDSVFLEYFVKDSSIDFEINYELCRNFLLKMF